MVGFTPPKSGSTMNAWPTHENAFTNRASGEASWSRSMSDSFGPVNRRSTPFTGGASAIGFVVSITVFPASPAPEAFTAASAAVPFTASTTIPPNAAVSANVPIEALAPAFAFQSASFAGWREPRITS